MRSTSLRQSLRPILAMRLERLTHFERRSNGSEPTPAKPVGAKGLQRRHSLARTQAEGSRRALTRHPRTPKARLQTPPNQHMSLPPSSFHKNPFSRPRRLSHLAPATTSQTDSVSRLPISRSPTRKSALRCRHLDTNCPVKLCTLREPEPFLTGEDIRDTSFGSFVDPDPENGTDILQSPLRQVLCGGRQH